MDCTFSVPELVPGLPRYGVEEAAQALMQNLIRNGYYVCRDATWTPWQLHIAWSDEFVQLQQDQRQQLGGSRLEPAAAQPARSESPGRGRGGGKPRDISDFQPAKSILRRQI